MTDSAGQQLAYVYFEDEPGRRSAAKLLSKDEARRISANIAKLPELLRKRAEGLLPPVHLRAPHAGCVTYEVTMLTYITLLYSDGSLFAIMSSGGSGAT